MYDGELCDYDAKLKSFNSVCYTKPRKLDRVQVGKDNDSDFVDADEMIWLVWGNGC